MLPSFIIAGTQKGGTTSLHYYLNEHPDVYMSEKKEVHFFDLNFEKGIGWYEKHFEHCKEVQTAGETTPFYMFHPDVPKRIKDLMPGIKIIFVLRNPIERAWSHYWHEVVKGRETLSFEEALEQEEKRIKQNQKYFQNKSYRSRGEYAEQIHRYISLFGSGQVLILLSEELRSNPENTLKEVFTFLGLDTEFHSTRILEKAKYEGKVPRSRYVNALIQSGMLKNVPFLKGLNNMFNFAGRKEIMSSETRSALESYYRPFNSSLADLLGRKDLWTKDT